MRDHTKLRAFELAVETEKVLGAQLQASLCELRPDKSINAQNQ